MAKASLSNSQKFLYAAGDFSQQGIENVLRLFLLFYLTEFVGFRPAMASMILIGGVVWDAISDPLMGWVSDKYYLQCKGRHPFVYFGAVFSGVLVGFMFTSHFWLVESPLAYFLLYVLLNTAITVFSVPHTSVPGDFPFTASLRTNLFAWRYALGNLGSLGASVLVAVLQGDLSSDSFYMVILGFAGANLIVGYLSAMGTKSIESSFPLKTHDHVPSLASFANALKNKAFVPLLLGFVLANIGVGISSAAALYYYKDYLKITENETGIILIVFFLVIAASLAGWVKISERFGKLKPLQIGSFLLGAGTCIAYPLFPVGNYWFPLVVGGVFLGALVGSVILLDSILTDVADLGELRFGSATTAIYFGIWKFASKLARALAIGITGFVIDSGVEGAIAAERLPWLFGPGVGSFLLVASVLMGLYGFTDVKQAKVARLLQKKKALRQRTQLS